MKLKHWLVCAAAALLGGGAFAQQPIIIKFSHVVAANTPKGEAAEYFKREAEARTKGRVQVQVFPNSTLYKDKEELEALQMGVVDGQENPVTNIYTQKFHEVQKYLTVTDHGYHGYVLVANKKFWDGLPPDIRSTLDGVVKDTSDFFYKAATKDEREALASLKASGRTQVVTLKPEEKLELKKALMKVHREVEPRVGKDLIEAIYRETDFSPDKL